MSKLIDDEKNHLKNVAAGENVAGPIEIDGWGAGFSSLLTLPPAKPFLNYGERRSGRDRRMSDRRLTAQEFSVPEQSS